MAVEGRIVTDDGAQPICPTLQDLSRLVLHTSHPLVCGLLLTPALCGGWSGWGQGASGGPHFQASLHWVCPPSTCCSPTSFPILGPGDGGQASLPSLVVGSGRDEEAIAICWMLVPLGWLGTGRDWHVRPAPESLAWDCMHVCVCVRCEWGPAHLTFTMLLVGAGAWGCPAQTPPLSGRCLAGWLSLGLMHAWLRGCLLSQPSRAQKAACVSPSPAPTTWFSEGCSSLGRVPLALTMPVYLLTLNSLRAGTEINMGIHRLFFQ